MLLTSKFRAVRWLKEGRDNFHPPTFLLTNNIRMFHVGGSPMTAPPRAYHVSHTADGDAENHVKGAYSPRVIPILKRSVILYCYYVMRVRNLCDFFGLGDNLCN